MDIINFLGGGIEGSEDEQTALLREVREEVGCDVQIIDQVGTVTEHRDLYGQKQTSTAFISRVSSGDGSSTFTDLEQSQGFQLMWVPIQEAVGLLKQDSPLNYEGRFIQQRDSSILSWALEVLNAKSS